ncbi:MAG: hypothetical protein QOG87_3982 [Actinomycetota bacterium]
MTTTTQPYTDTVVGFAYMVRKHADSSYELLERKVDGELVSMGTYDSPGIVMNVLDTLDES